MCDVCKRDGVKNIGVFSSALGPMSMAYCAECGREGAEPEWGFEYLYSEVGRAGEGLAEFVNELKAWKEGRYWTWAEWVAWRRLPEQAHLDEKAAAQREHFMNEAKQAATLDQTEELPSLIDEPGEHQVVLDALNGCNTGEEE